MVKYFEKMKSALSPLMRSKSTRLGFFGLLSVMVICAGKAFAAEDVAAEALKVDYRYLDSFETRNVVWLVMQLHLLFGSFILGVPIFAWICELMAIITKDPKMDGLAYEFSKLTVGAAGTTGILGGMALFLMVIFYPKFWAFMTNIFWPSYIVYFMLFIFETVCLYMWAYAWHSMEKGKLKFIHLLLGLGVNVAGFLIMCVSDGWMGYMMSPVVLPDGLDPWATAWMAMQNFTWWPYNIHRIIGNIMLGGFIVGAYAGLRFLGAKNTAEKKYYDWMGYIGNFIGTFGFLPLPFAGYWLMRELYMYSQQMGITLMGGFLAWLFILQAILIGMLFIGVNYYFWVGLASRTEGAHVYKKAMGGMLFILVVSVGIWMTPRTMIATPSEMQAMGGASHPILGYFGVMSAKVTVVNLMILVTFISFLMYWRANQIETTVLSIPSKVFQVILFLGVTGAVIYLGVDGYRVPALVRINVYSTTQVLMVAGTMLVVTPLTWFTQRTAKPKGEMKWGNMPVRSQYALMLNGIVVLVLMVMMGYARSAARVHYHVFGVMEDTSKYAYSPSLGEASIMWALIVTCFVVMISFIFWLTSLSMQQHHGEEEGA